MRNETTLESQEERPGRIVVVEDDPRSRRFMCDLLFAEGMEVYAADDGEEALEVVEEKAPDVVLLDAMMPHMDGFETCLRLKGNERTSPIPVLMLTSLSDRDTRIKGISAGANDFLQKPVDAQDVLLRVRNAVYTKRLFDRVQQDVHRLQMLESLREDLTKMVVHDMRTPLTVISLSLHLLEEELEGEINGACAEYIRDSSREANRLVEMVNSLLDVSKLESGAMSLRKTECDLVAVAERVVHRLGVMTEGREVDFRQDKGVLTVECDQQLIERVLLNLIGNALKHTGPVGGVRIAGEKRDGAVSLSVTDDGPGIDPRYHQKIFEKFGQVEHGLRYKGYSTGLGLTFCKLAIEAHGGEIGVESASGRGSTFWFKLPVDVPAPRTRRTGNPAYGKHAVNAVASMTGAGAPRRHRVSEKG